MTALLVVLLTVLFLLTDVAVREVTKRLAATRARRAREAALKTSVRLEFAGEAKSLKRVEVADARGRILAVDDEPVVLDSFRKILVIAGFSVDTVENGPEALHLVRTRDYDFVFTDLKMPGMDGVEVVRAVKHVRPDVDVAVITGYATVESAVETMKDGAVDYVQKPFTEDELVAFAERLRIRREARLEAERRPVVRILAPEVADILGGREYGLPGGAFIAAGHTWARILPAGQVVVGLDDFARKALERVERVELPPDGAPARRGEALFTLRHGDRTVWFASPVTGQIVHVNEELRKNPGLVIASPYDRGWICMLQPANLGAELTDLRIGRAAVDWIQEEVARLRHDVAANGDAPLEWPKLQSGFFAAGKPRAEHAAAQEATVPQLR